MEKFARSLESGTGAVNKWLQAEQAGSP